MARLFLVCALSLVAGDMYMAPDSWKDVYNSLLGQVKDGR